MPRGRRSLRLALPSSTRARVAGATGAVALTATAVGIGVLAPAPASSPASSSPAPQAQGSLADAAAVAELADEERSIGTSRSVVRRPALEPRVPKVEKKLWTTAPLKLRVQPREETRSRGTFPDDERIGVTGERKNGFAQVVVDGQARWVTADYLSKEKQVEPEVPETGAAAGVNTAPCANGAVASGGLQPRAQTVMNAVCNAFPDITTYGGAAGRGEHGTGLAIDIMVSGARGEQVKQFLYANASQFGLSNIIYAQTIWSAQRGGEGFRGMENRGSSTANHFDHVHVLVG
ncbi:SH3 domain-containing protein [Nocardioides aequoreus]|uniref:SH3 domain-containing protein n=1 Tax=Nocardioides aequoreus TaxID=397278 RepID=UPI000692434B|nr:SH3 domain-containing protein [Nocardioides aequoreus]